MSKVINYSHKNTAGIYRISNTINDKIYIGSSKHLYYRKMRHLSDLRRNVHKSPQLQNFVNKYGSDTLIFEILCIVNNPDRLTEIEDKFVKQYDPFYNTLRIIIPSGGSYRTQETKDKISKTLTGFKRPKQSKIHTRRMRKYKLIPILQYDLNNNFVKRWNSRIDAANELNIQLSTICGCATGKKYHRTAGGFIWRNEPKQLNLIFKENAIF